MIFALGFLVASLCALVLVPVLNSRAMRLARRRIDGLFPLSVREIAAERDALRAEFAVAQRRMERKVEAAQVKCHADMQALGARDLDVAALERNVEARDATLAERKAEIEAATARLEALDHTLATLRTDHATGLAALAALEQAHAELLTDLKATRRERDGVRHDIQDVLATEEGSTAHALNSERMAHATDVAKANAALHALRAEHDALASDRDALQASLRAAEEALSRARADGGEATRRENAELRGRITEVADALMRGEHLPAVGPFPASAGS